MKKIIIIILLIHFFSTFSSYANGNLIAYWSFDDSTARDNSGNGYDGTIMFHPKFVPGVKGKAIWLEGRGYYCATQCDLDSNNLGDHVLLPYIDFKNYPEFSVTLWVRQEGFSSPGGEAYIFFGHIQNGWLGLMNHIYNNPNELYLHATVGAKMYEPEIASIYPKSFTNKWIFYSITYKKNILKFYINGNLINEKKIDVNYFPKYAALGRHWWYHDNEERTSARFTGAIDEVKIYKHALTEEEIKEEFQGPDLYFHFPDTVATIGKYICLPMHYHSKYELPIPDNVHYKILVSIDKSVLWDDINSSGFIMNDKKYFEFEGTLNQLVDKSIKICGTALLGNKKTTPIHFESIDLDNFKADVYYDDGSITLTGVCQQTISRIQPSYPPKIEIQQINFSNSINAKFTLYYDSNVNYSIYNMWGEKIIHKELGVIQKNRRKLLINIINLQEGIYFIQINISGFLFTKKILIIK